jgi:hypothetical protein
MVEEHIKQLLHDHDCVIIPDFGGLITDYVSARIHPVKHTFVPPSRRIAFNEKLKLDDGLLINTIAHQNKLSSETAQARVAEFVKEMQEELRVKYKFEMRGIGLFRLNFEQKIEFEYIETENLLEESFGLPELVSRPVLAAPHARMRTIFQDKPVSSPIAGKKTVRSRIYRLYKVAAAVVIGGLAFSGLYYLSSQTDASLGSLNPVGIFMPDAGHTAIPAPSVVGPTYSHASQLSEEEAREMYREFYPSGLADDLLINLYQEQALAQTFDWEDYIKTIEDASSEDPGQENGTLPVVAELFPDMGANEKTSTVKETVKAVVVAPKIKSAAKAKPAATPVASPVSAGEKEISFIEKETGRFYVIAGGYSSLENAQVGLAALKKKGENSKIIMPYKGSKLYRVSVADYENWEAAYKELKNFRSKYGTSIWVLNY